MPGIDGIGTGRHACDAVAPEDSELCVIPFAKLDEFSRRFEPLQHHFNKAMSREIVREHGSMLMLGSLLGLKLGTVSRLFSRFQREGAIAVRGKRVRIANESELGKRAALSC